jgi:hypothetical protein
MARKRGRRARSIKQSRLKRAYTLQDVRSKIAQGKYRVTNNARVDANSCFGWGIEDIEDAFSKLQNKHYKKSMRSKTIAGVILDVYHAEGLKGEDVYIHFYIKDGLLRINSVHELRKT